MQKGNVKKDEKKEPAKDPLNAVILVGFTMIGLVLAFSIFLITDTLEIKTFLKQRMIQALLTDKINEITLEIEEKYNGMVTQAFNEERQNIQDEADSLRQMKLTLEREKEELDIRTKNMSDMEKQWEAKLETVTAKERELFGTAQNITELSKVYAKMDPKRAAEILTSMKDDDLAVLILFSMKETESAAVLGQMKDEYAALMTVKRVKNSADNNNAEITE